MDNPFDRKVIPITSVASGKGQELLPDLYMYTDQIVNLFFVGDANGWVVVDAGMPRSAGEIIAEAEARFVGAKPRAIVLTHGHFDHVGSIVDLIRHWNIPVYAHEAELPYLTGRLDYPPADPTVGGGLNSLISPLFPNEAIDLTGHVEALPASGDVAVMPGWRAVPTPGHAPGHISLFRESDRTLLAGDAFVTVKQESVYKVMTQQLEMNGPPKYFTIDWELAEASVKKLNDLRPALAATGHGQPMRGDVLAEELGQLARHFRERAVPEHGRYAGK